MTSGTNTSPGKVNKFSWKANRVSWAANRPFGVISAVLVCWFVLPARVKSTPRLAVCPDVENWPRRKSFGVCDEGDEEAEM